MTSAELQNAKMISERLEKAMVALRTITPAVGLQTYGAALEARGDISFCLGVLSIYAEKATA